MAVGRGVPRADMTVLMQRTGVFDMRVQHLLWVALFIPVFVVLGRPLVERARG